jgi:hypothetical protein
MSDSNVDYFARRAREERSAANLAQDPVIASVHSEMAELYENASRVSGEPFRMPIRLIGDPAGA